MVTATSDTVQIELLRSSSILELGYVTATCNRCCCSSIRMVAKMLIVRSYIMIQKMKATTRQTVATSSSWRVDASQDRGCLTETTLTIRHAPNKAIVRSRGELQFLYDGLMTVQIVRAMVRRWTRSIMSRSDRSPLLLLLCQIKLLLYDNDWLQHNSTNSKRTCRR